MAVTDITEESGLEFLLRLQPSYEYNMEEFGKFSSTDFILVSTPCSQSKSSVITRILSHIILPKLYGGLDQGALYLDLDYHLNSLSLLEALERRLKNLKIPNSKCDNVISKSPSNLKVIRSSTSLELICVLSSLPEIILQEKVSLIVCDCPSLYTLDRAEIDHLYMTLYRLPAATNVTVIFVCCLLLDMPFIKFPHAPDIVWSIGRTSDCSDQFTLCVKQGLKTLSEKKYIL